MQRKGFIHVINRGSVRVTGPLVSLVGPSVPLSALGLRTPYSGISKPVGRGTRGLHPGVRGFRDVHGFHDFR